MMVIGVKGVRDDRQNPYMTSTEFLDLPETNTPMMLIDGEIIVSPTPSPVHQLSFGQFYSLIHAYKPNGEVILSPADIYFDEFNTVQPDIFWIAEGGNCVEGEKFFIGAPDLVVEVLSPSAARNDRSDKFKLYQRHGVREYWLVDPIAQYVEVWRLENDHFVQQGAYGEGEQFESAALGKMVMLRDIFSR